MSISPQSRETRRFASSVHELCIALALMACAQTLATAGETGLFVDGYRLQRIVIPANSPADLTYAAKLLRHYISECCGDSLEITPSDARLRAPAVYVGSPGWSAVRHIAAPGLSEEAVYLRGQDGELALLGGGVRGAVYSVFVFLEEKVGVRWYQPSPWGEELPKKARVDLPRFQHQHEPSFWFRDVSICLHPPIGEWAVRNRLNTNLRAHGKGRGGSNEYALGGHAFTKYVKPAYFEDHPEYFPIKDGQRYLPRADRRGKYRVQACTTRPGVFRLFVTGMRRALDRYPDRRLVSISPDDVTGRWCSCPHCNALDTGEMMALHGRERRVVSDRFFSFANALGDCLAASHPRARMTTFAYHQYRPVPKRIRIRPNIVVMLCQPGAYNHPINSGASQQIREFQRNVLDWTRACDNMIFYRYMFKTMWESLPYPRHRILAADLKYAHSLGFAGEHGQSHGKNWGMLGLNWYLHAKLLWDVDRSIDELLDDYYRGYFREAEKPMRRYFGLMATAFRGADGPIGEYRLISPKIYANRFLNPDLLRRARGSLDEAAGAAKSDREKHRVRLVEIAFRYAEHYMQGLWAQQRFEEKREEHDLRTALAEYEAAVETAKEGEPIWAIVYNFNEGARRWLTEREIPKLRRTLAAEFAWRQRRVADVPVMWRFRFEGDANGEREGWFRPDFDDDDWHEVRVDRAWQEQGLAKRDFRGAGWYRTVVDVPPIDTDSRVLLYFGGIDAAGKVWVNGSRAGEHKYVPDVSWREPCKLDVSGLIHAGKNLIAVRVYTGGGNGGLYRPVRLASDSNTVLLLPKHKVSWGRPAEIKDGPDWELTGGSHAPIATIRTPGREDPNPYDGSWIELKLPIPRGGLYQVWIRVVQYQADEAKAITIDGAQIGTMHSRPRADARGYTEFHRVGAPINLAKGDHTLRIECRGIRGWIDPISAVLVTGDLQTDFEKLQTDHSPGSAPAVDGKRIR